MTEISPKTRSRRENGPKSGRDKIRNIKIILVASLRAVPPYMRSHRGVEKMGLRIPLGIQILCGRFFPANSWKGSRRPFWPIQFKSAHFWRQKKPVFYNAVTIFSTPGATGVRKNGNSMVKNWLFLLSKVGRFKFSRPEFSRVSHFWRPFCTS